MSMANVARFRELMMTYPLAVLVDDKRMALFAYKRRYSDGTLQKDHDFELKNHKLMCEAADLFWKDDDVFTFVMDHHGLEIGLTGARVKSIQPGQIRIPQKGEVKDWQQPNVNPETGEVETSPAPSPELKKDRAHEKKIEIRSKHLSFSF